MDSENRIEFLYKKAMSLPLLPGVYRMKEENGNIIYIGKAKVLKNRVKSYFTNIESHLSKVYAMVCSVYDFDFIVTDSEFEALVLECSQIKEFSPKYNILLKDDKGYNYIKITNEIYPKIQAVFGSSLKNTAQNENLIGPYMSSFQVKQAVDEANKIYKLHTCNRRFPQDFRKKRPCLYYYIEQCAGLCTGKISLEEHKKALDEAVLFLKGGAKEHIKNLTAKMKALLQELKFEEAAKIRDRIESINKLSLSQKVYDTKLDTFDTIALTILSDDCKKVYYSLEIFRFSEFRLVDEKNIILQEKANENVLSSFITQYYKDEKSIPPFIFVSEEFEDKDLVEKYLSNLATKRVYIAVPKRGEHKRILDLCLKNSLEHLSHKLSKNSKEIKLENELKNLLNLNSVKTIESYDISHTASSNAVGAMIVYRDMKPYKDGYRRFKLDETVAGNDIASLENVLIRRFNEYKKLQFTHENDNYFASLPDLILMDGGKAQVLVAKKVLKEFDLDIPTFGLVKDGNHKTRAIATDGSEIAILNLKDVFAFLTKLQDEVHRFAITYHKSLSSKNMTISELSSISGLGDKRIKILYDNFKTIENIKNASLSDLIATKGIPKNIAENIYNHFHK